MRTTAETGVTQLSIAKQCQRLPANQQNLGTCSKVFPYRFQRSQALLTPSFFTSSLQNCEMTHFCGLKPPSLWYPSQQHQESNTNGNNYKNKTKPRPVITKFLLWQTLPMCQKHPQSPFPLLSSCRKNAQLPSQFTVATWPLSVQ